MSPGDGFAGLPALLPPSTPRTFYEMVDFGSCIPLPLLERTYFHQRQIGVSSPIIQ